MNEGNKDENSQMAQQQAQMLSGMQETGRAEDRQTESPERQAMTQSRGQGIRKWMAAAEDDPIGQSREEEEENERTKQLIRRLRESPRLKQLLDNPHVASLLYERENDDPIHDRTQRQRLDDSDSEDGSEEEEKEKQAETTKMDGKAALVLGMNDVFYDQEEEEDDVQRKGIRRAPGRFEGKLEETTEEMDRKRASRYE